MSSARRTTPRGRVAVTGLGAVSPFGIGVEELWSSLREGKSAAGPSPPSPRGISVPATAAVVGEHSRRVEEHVDPRFLRRLSSLSRHAVGAAALCARSAGGAQRWISAEPEALVFRDETAVVLGTAFGCSSYHFEYYEKLFRNGIKDASPLLFSESVTNAASGHISIYLKLRGASLALVGGEEVGLSALLDAADRIRLGKARAAFAGGAEEYCDFVHAALFARGLVSAEAGEPCSGSGRGTFPGEGAAFLLLEPLEPVRAAGLTPLAVLAGSGAARSLDGPAGADEAIERAASLAIEEAGIRPDAVGLVVTSASGGPMDSLEAEGIARALCVDRFPANEVLVTAPKAALGEGFAFTSAAQALVAVKALVEQVVPPTAGRTADARLPRGLRLASRRIESLPERRLEHALVVSVSSRGSAVAVVFSTGH